MWINKFNSQRAQWGKKIMVATHGGIPLKSSYKRDLGRRFTSLRTTWATYQHSSQNQIKRAGGVVQKQQLGFNPQSCVSRTALNLCHTVTAVFGSYTWMISNLFAPCCMLAFSAVILVGQRCACFPLILELSLCALDTLATSLEAITDIISLPSRVGLFWF